MSASVTGEPPDLLQIWADVLRPGWKKRIASAPASRATSRKVGIKAGVRSSSESMAGLGRRCGGVLHRDMMIRQAYRGATIRKLSLSILGGTRPTPFLN